jgi:hypothetical protein
VETVEKSKTTRRSLNGINTMQEKAAVEKPVHGSGYLRYVSATCTAEGWPEPVAEYVFAPPRRWRFDLAWPKYWLAIEVQGGLHTQGRHTRGAALQAEYDKLNAAQTLGWVVLLVTPADLTNGRGRELLRAFFARHYPTTIGPGRSRSDWEGGEP